MILTKKKINITFLPIIPVVLYLFLTITTLHLEVPFLLKIHIEALALIATLVITILSILKNKNLDLNHPIIYPTIVGLLYISSLITTSIFNQNDFQILKDEEFIDLFKMILFAPCLVYFLIQKEYKDKILNFVIFAYNIFGLYYLYRFLILKEARSFDLRPQLKIRHGDANFLCTFFSMMVPLALMQALKYWNEMKKSSFIYMTGSALFFIYCSLLTESRMGIIALALGLMYLFNSQILPFPRKKVIIIFTSFFVIIYSISGKNIINRFSQIEDKSNSDRYLTWINGVKVFLDNPIIGAGMHNAKNYFYQNTNYPSFQSEFKQLEVHNSFLKAASELGLQGLFTFLLMFSAPWIDSIKIESGSKFFLISSMTILTLSIMTIGLIYKDLFILHLYLVSALASPNK